MKITVNEENELQLEEVYSGVVLKTRDKEWMGICMRDSGFEFNYMGTWYEAKNGEVRRRDSNVTTELEISETDGIIVVTKTTTVEDNAKRDAVTECEHPQYAQHQAGDQVMCTKCGSNVRG